MKKLISTLVASAMATCSLASISVFASNDTNQINITTETLETSVISANGAVIPSGSTAVTVSISGNTGFSAKSVKFDLGECDVITDESNTPVVVGKNAINDSIIGAMENNGVMVVATASAYENNDDGELFTFYVCGNTEDLIITDIDPVVNRATTMAGRPKYIIGDANGDEIIDGTDATAILTAISIYQKSAHTDVLPVSIANTNKSTYFPAGLPKKAEAADSNEDGSISNYDANCVMNYYMASLTDNDYDFDTMSYVGEERYFTPTE